MYNIMKQELIKKLKSIKDEKKRLAILESIKTKQINKDFIK